MKVSDFMRYGVFSLLLLQCVSCRSGIKYEKIELHLGDAKFTIELAVSMEQKAQGLMFRKKMDRNRGMLFVYDHDQRMSFWMKNTLIPLTVGYISSDGILKETYDMIPQNTQPVESRHSVRYALELNRGRFEELGFKPGDRVFNPDIVREAIHRNN